MPAHILTFGQPFIPADNFAPLDVIERSNLNPNAKRVYRKLFAYGRSSGKPFAFPSIKRLAEELNISVRRITSNISALVQQGYLLREARRRADGSQATNRIYLLWHPAFNEATDCQAPLTAASPHLNLKVISEETEDLDQQGSSRQNRETLPASVGECCIAPDASELEQIRELAENILSTDGVPKSVSVDSAIKLRDAAQGFHVSEVLYALHTLWRRGYHGGGRGNRAIRGVGFLIRCVQNEFRGRRESDPGRFYAKSTFSYNALSTPDALEIAA